ncbi:flagellar export protein FliJ [Terrilactibacillus sp. S3-3]|nr:flagellar export protein FliJ [Terrilactibacillus sp. S3-3]
MAFEFRLERLMQVAESERKQLEVEYQRIYDSFEQIAGRLVRLIEKKQAIETALQEKLQESMTLDLMRRQLADVENIDRLIEELTIQYNKVKVRLEKFQPVLKEKAIEVKKYEKIKTKEWLACLSQR